MRATELLRMSLLIPPRPSSPFITPHRSQHLPVLYPRMPSAQSGVEDGRTRSNGWVVLIACSWRLIASLIRAMECPAAAGCTNHVVLIACSWRRIASLIRAMECPAAAGCMYHLKRLPASYMLAPPQPFEMYTFDSPEIAIGLPSQQERTCRFVGN